MRLTWQATQEWSLRLLAHVVNPRYTSVTLPSNTFPAQSNCTNDFAKCSVTICEPFLNHFCTITCQYWCLCEPLSTLHHSTVSPCQVPQLNWLGWGMAIGTMPLSPADVVKKQVGWGIWLHQMVIGLFDSCAPVLMHLHLRLMSARVLKLSWVVFLSAITIRTLVWPDCVFASHV